MFANEITKEERPKRSRDYPMDELKAIVRQGYRRLAVRESNPSSGGLALAKWDDIVSRVRRLKLRPEPRYPDKSTLLWEMLDDTEIASILVRSGADLKAKRHGDKSKSSFLHVLASSDDPKKHQLAVLMIERGADVNDVDAKGNTALHAAAESEAIGLVEILLRKKANPLSLGYKSESPLKLALRTSTACVQLKLFLEHCDLNAFYCCNCLPWDMSRDHLSRVVETLLQLVGQREKCVEHVFFRCFLSMRLKFDKLLLSYKANAKQRLINPQILLYYSLLVPASLATIIFLTREFDANVNACVTNERQYPLHLECKRDRRDTVQLLLRLGADVNVTNKRGETPFSMTAYEGDAAAKVMIRHFARLASAGETVNEIDLSIVREKPNLQQFYESCVEELDRMKTTEAVRGFSYYDFFGKTSYEVSLFMMNSENFIQLEKNLLQLETKIFSTFADDVMMKFEVAKKIRTAVISWERELEDVFTGILPWNVTCKIARYSLDIVDIEREYHMSCYE